jgi:uncharacterized protein YoxC
MEKVDLSKVAESCRPDLRIIGGTLGTQFFKPEARAAILDFEKRKVEVERNGNVDLILNRTPRRFRVVGHDILSVQLANGALGDAQVILNKDTEDEVSVSISSDGKTFSNVTEDALGKALTGDKNIIFADAKKLIEKVNVLNYDEKERLVKLREEINKAIAQVDSAINENNKKSKEYYDQLTKGSNPEDASTPVVVNLPGKTAPASKEVIVVTD